MVRPDQDVVHARGQEPARDGERALPRAREVLEARVVAVEDRLGLQRAVLVDVEERLVGGIVGEQRCAHPDEAGGTVHRAREADPDRASFGDDLGRCRRSARERAIVRGELEPRQEHRDDVAAPGGEPRGIEEEIRGLEPEVVREIEDVGDHGEVHGLRAE